MHQCLIPSCGTRWRIIGRCYPHFASYHTHGHEGVWECFPVVRARRRREGSGDGQPGGHLWWGYLRWGAKRLGLWLIVSGVVVRLPNYLPWCSLLRELNFFSSLIAYLLDNCARFTARLWLRLMIAISSLLYMPSERGGGVGRFQRFEDVSAHGYVFFFYWRVLRPYRPSFYHKLSTYSPRRQPATASLTQLPYRTFLITWLHHLLL